MRLSPSTALPVPHILALSRLTIANSRFVCLRCFFLPPISVPERDPVADLLSSANPLSVSRIYHNGGGACTFFGKNGGNTFVLGLHTADVALPGPIIAGVCDI